MNNLKNKGRGFFLRVIAIALILVSLCCNMICGCGKRFDVSDNYFYIKATDTQPEEYYEAKYMGNSITKTVCGKNVTAVYEKTIYKALGDITKYRYQVTSVEGENDTSDLYGGYIELDAMGEVIGSGGDIGYIDIQCRYDYEQDHLLDSGYSFGISKDELRAMAEETLGAVVDWSLYNYFTIEFSEPFEFIIGLKQTAYPVYTSVFLTWHQRITGCERDDRNMLTSNTVMCTLNFASWDKNTGHIFHDKSYISEFHIETPLSGKANLSKYVDRVPSAVSTYWNKLSDQINTDVSGNTESGLTVYNGKVCYFQKARSYIMIIPLE